MSRYDDTQLDTILRDFLRDRADDTDGMAAASELSAAIEWRVGRSRSRAISFRRLIVIAAVIALVLAAIGVAMVGRRSVDLPATVAPAPPSPCASVSCPPPEPFAGLPYHVDLSDTWIGGSPDTYESNVEWYRSNVVGRGWAVPAIYPVVGGPRTNFMAYDTDQPGMRLAISGPSTVPADTDVEREISVWESSYDATGTVDRVTLPAGEARRAREGPDRADGYLRITYLVVVGRDMYTLRFAYDPAVDRTDEIAALAATFRVP